LPAICSCQPTEPLSEQYRGAAKHVTLPDGAGEEITITEILGWALGKTPSFDAPRSGRELNLYHVAHAYLHAVSPNTVDCDIHFEVSESPDELAPRIITEIPIDAPYCSARQAIQAQLAERGFRFTVSRGVEVEPAVPVEIRGLAFRDADPGSPTAATPWELHPAVFNVLPQ
jgi:hypothetical protein